MAQVEVRGRVTDAFTKEPVPYVYISAVGDTSFAFTDSEGFFTILLDRRAATLTALNEGYLPANVSIQPIEDLFVTFELTASADQMSLEGGLGAGAAESVRKASLSMLKKRRANNESTHPFY